jgi:hypothetical protein
MCRERKYGNNQDHKFHHHGHLRRMLLISVLLRTGIALDADNQIIGYKFVSLGKMTDFIKKGDDPNTAYEKACGQYGRVADAVKIIDPRTDKEVK